MTQKKGLLHEVFQLRATALVIMSAVSLQAPLPPLTRSPSPVVARGRRGLWYLRESLIK